MDFDDLGIGEPADQVDVVHGEIDDDAEIDIRGGNGPTRVTAIDRQDLALDGSLIASTAGFSAQHGRPSGRNAGAPRRGDDLAAFLDGGGDRLLTRIWMPRAAHSTAMSRCRWVGVYGDGIDAALDQAVEVGKGRALEVPRELLARFAVGIDEHASQLDTGQFRQHPRRPDPITPMPITPMAMRQSVMLRQPRS